MTQGDILKKLYYQVLRIRLVEETIVELYPEQQMRCPVHLCIGQEAVAAAVGVALEKKDMVMSGHRAHGHYLAKGGNLNAMMAEIYGKAAGCCQGRGGSMHLIDLKANFLGSTPIVAGTIPVAVGVAWAEQLTKTKAVTVMFLGEGATEEGVWHESMNFAALHRLPILFVCENNLYSVYTPLKDRQPKRSVARLAAGYGMTTMEGDGNDAWQVYQKVKKALVQARSGKGPVFLEFSTYRWREHCGPNYDNTIGYRTEVEFKRWQKKDPLPRLEALLLRKKVVDSKYLLTTRRRIEKEIEAAVQFAQSSPFPSADHIELPGIYAD